MADAAAPAERTKRRVVPVRGPDSDEDGRTLFVLTRVEVCSISLCLSRVCVCACVCVCVPLQLQA